MSNTLGCQLVRLHSGQHLQWIQPGQLVSKLNYFSCMCVGTCCASKVSVCRNLDVKICFNAFDTHIETTVSKIIHWNSCRLAPANQTTQKIVRNFNSVEDALSIVVNLLFLQVIIMTGHLHNAISYGVDFKHVFFDLVRFCQLSVYQNQFPFSSV